MKDAWDLPAIRVTYKDHPDDLTNARFLQDRGAEICRAAGGGRVHRPVDAWHPAEGEPPVPVLEGQRFHFNESPNRFGLPAFYELHVWAWRDNPNGTFVDWNPRVSCDGL